MSDPTTPNNLEEDDNSSMSSDLTDDRTPVDGPDDEDEMYPLISQYENNDGDRESSRASKNIRTTKCDRSSNKSLINDEQPPPLPPRNTVSLHSHEELGFISEKPVQSSLQGSLNTSKENQNLNHDDQTSISELTATSFERGMLRRSSSSIPTIPSHHSPRTGKRRRPRLVHFDETRNQEYEDKVRTVEDAHKTWYKAEEYESFVVVYHQMVHHEQEWSLQTLFSQGGVFTMDNIGQFLCVVLVGCCSVATRL